MQLHWHPNPSPEQYLSPVPTRTTSNHSKIQKHVRQSKQSKSKTSLSVSLFHPSNDHSLPASASEASTLAAINRKLSSLSFYDN